MSKPENIPIVLEKALAEWKKQETLKKKRTSIRNFAKFLGYSQAIVGFWLNKNRKMSEKNLVTITPKLVELLGTEVYTELDIPKPDPYKEYILKHWDKIPPKKQKEIINIMQKYTDNSISWKKSNETK